MTTLNFADFRQQWLADFQAHKPAVDPDWLGTSYAAVLINADYVVYQQRQVSGWWDADVHGPARIEGDLTSDGSTWNIDDPTIDPDQVDIPTLRELWVEVTKEIRREVSPRNYEHWQPIASQIGAELETTRLRRLVPMI